MTDDTKPATAHPTTDDSTIWNVSVRAWVTLIIIVTICSMALMQIPIDEHLRTLGGLVVAFYFGQKKLSK